MAVHRPIFIVGPHRSGTTLLYRILSKHPDVAYFTPLNKRLPNSPRLAHLLTGLIKPDYPVEAQSVWDRFKTKDVDLMDAADATAEVREWYHRLVKRVLKLRGADRFLSKYPRLSLRLSWIDALFPDAIFIHMVRDWRGVVNSTLNRKVKREKRQGGWFGVFVPGWRDMEGLPHEVVSARVFKLVTENLERASARYEGRFFKTSYEDLCKDPVPEVRRITQACDLTWGPAFEQSIPKNLKSANYKWRENLDEELISRIREEDIAFFARYELA
jgi:hypothetical protein